MFITKKNHEQLVKLLSEQYEARISELHDQVSDLRRLVFSPDTSQPSPIAREADAIITVSEFSTAEPPETDQDVIEAEIAEFNRILTGEYESFEEAIQ